MRLGVLLITSYPIAIYISYSSCSPAQLQFFFFSRAFFKVQTSVYYQRLTLFDKSPTQEQLYNSWLVPFTEGTENWSINPIFVMHQNCEIFPIILDTWQFRLCLMAVQCVVSTPASIVRVNHLNCFSVFQYRGQNYFPWIINIAMGDPVC